MNKQNKPYTPYAFPSVVEDTGRPSEVHQGMTLRDYFAASAMQGIIAKMGFYLESDGEERTWEKAYAYADAMLKEREE